MYSKGGFQTGETHLFRITECAKIKPYAGCILYSGGYFGQEVPVMQIFVRVKAVGKRKDILSPAAYELPENTDSLRKLLTAIVEMEVMRYNQKETGAQLIPFLTREELENKASAGKVGFGSIYSERKAEKDKAIENAIQCWQDGLVRVFMEDMELDDLDAPVLISEGTAFTFIRLTFLAGRMW